jgi:thiamine biosynthesis lipoprotein
MMRFVMSLRYLSWMVWTAVALFCSPGSAGETSLQRYQYTQLHMGVQVRITLYAPDEPSAERACAAAFRRFAGLEDILSDYRPSSELMRLCARAGGPPVPVSPDLFLVLERAADLSRRTGGAFDVTVGPYMALWRKARKTGKLPAAADLQTAARLVGWRKVRLDEEKRTVQLLVPGMRLDLGGIAKGYAGDCAQAVLKQHGVTRALVEAGGDIVVSGPPPGKDGWRIEVASAGPEKRTVSLANAAISSSGDTEQFVEIAGRRYSHIVDPRTGLGLTDRIAATVIAPDGITSDSLSTAVSVLGPERGPALARTYKGVLVTVRRASPMAANSPRNSPR